MLPVHIDEKLKLFRDKEYIILQTNEETDVVEDSQDGRVLLKCKVCQESIFLTNPEQNVLPYLDTTKKGARSCADVFIYTLDEITSKWILHIIEFKKTIDIQKIGKSKKQLTMGIYNARAVSAFLGMDIQDVILYSGYRNDKLTAKEQSSLIAIRASNNREAVEKIKEWEKGICSLTIDNVTKPYAHKKIKLDINGYGSLVI